MTSRGPSLTNPITPAIWLYLSWKMGRTKETYNKLILILASVTFCLYLIDISLAFFQIINSRDSRIMKIAAKRGVPFDNRSLAELIRDLKERGLEAYPAIWPGTIIRDKGLQNGFPWKEGRILPLAGISRVLTVLGNETGQYAVYQSDEHGFNNPMGLHQEDRMDMVLIGDSLTQGCCVDSGQDLGSLLRKGGWKVLNLGYGFNGPLLELATLMEYGKALRPTVVVWLYFEGNDLLELSKEAELSSRLMYYLEHNFFQGLGEKQKEIDQLLRNYFERSMEKDAIGEWGPQKNNSIIRKLLTLSHLRERLGLGRLLKRPFEKDLFMRILQKADNEARSWGGNLVFVFLPARERFTPNIKPDRFLNRSEVLTTVHDLNIPLIDVVEDFSAHQKPLALFPFETEPHYNRQGYAVVARAIEKHLKGMNLLKEPESRKQRETSH